MSYQLISDGDLLEKIFYLRMSLLLPHYEEFWQKFVVPSTMREIDGSIHLRPGIYRDLELAFIHHYSCYCHLGMAHEILDMVAERLYLIDDFFFHLHAGMEMVSRKKKDRKQLKEDKGFLKYCANVRAKIIPPIKGESCYNSLANALGDDWKSRKTEFDNLLGEVSDYRNAITHDPRLGMIIANTRRWIPKHDLVRNKTWSEIACLSFPNEFLSVDELVKRLIDEVPVALNALWPEIICEFERLSQMDQYQKMARTGPYAPERSEPGEVSEKSIHSAYIASTETTISGMKVDTIPYSSGSADSWIPPSSDKE